MRHIRNVLTCLFEKRLSKRRTGEVTGVHRSTVHEYLERFNQASLSWPLPTDMDDSALEKLLFPNQAIREHIGVVIDFEYIHEELKKRGATLATLHAEWIEQMPEEQHISYSQFCKRYDSYKRSLRISMRRTEVYGETAYVDYSGATIGIIDSTSGESRAAQVFIGVLGGSSYTYCEATWTQRSRDWLSSHARMFEYFGGVPRVIVPDNLKGAVTKADRFSPVINETYSAMCHFYDTVPFPARGRKPKDKARAEGAVLLVQRWILFRLRKRKFFSLEEANREIRTLLEQLNHKPFQKLSGSRYSRWIEHELPTLLPLPATPYEYVEWGKVRAGLDYHVKVDGHHYSLPHELRGKEVDFRMTDKVVELLYKGRSIAVHQRSFAAEQVTTSDAHRHPAHTAVQRWDKDEALSWAAKIGPNTQALLRAQLAKAFTTLMGYRVTQAMKLLAKIHGEARLEAGSAYALQNNLMKATVLREILDKHLDQLFAQEANVETTPEIKHENIRGAEYYERLLTTEKETQE